MKENKSKDLSQYAGKWVAVRQNQVIAYGQTLEDIADHVTVKDKTINDDLKDKTCVYAIKVPKKSEKKSII